MIKKVSLILVIVTLVSLISLPINTRAKTVAEFEAEVKKYTKELEETKASLAKNESEVKAIEKKIRDYENQIKTAEAEIVELQKEIDASNIEIERKSEESKKIIEYYQVANGTNAYKATLKGLTPNTGYRYRLVYTGNSESASVCNCPLISATHFYDPAVSDRSPPAIAGCQMDYS